jgi:hypothetical protein
MMAEEAFALSPISARPTLPGEADYDAIREAFMETARGRWFLAEYAKRNRTADTSLVLEAVTRLEANLAAQKQAPALSLIAALGAIRSAVRQAKASAIEAMPRVDTDEVLTGARNGTRIIREIAWTLRECGADTRICDLLDTQVKAIEAGQQALNGNGREDVLASYDSADAADRADGRWQRGDDCAGRTDSGCRKGRARCRRGARSIRDAVVQVAGERSAG